MKRKIAIVTGSRGEYGYIRPIMRMIDQDPDLSYELILTNMHVLPEFGYSLQEIQNDGFNASEIIYNTLDGYNHVTMVKSLGIFLMHIPEILYRVKPDIILTAGDRGEQLMAAMAGAHMYVPVAHIQAGEVSGNIDDATRHAIARYAHIHFAANKQAAERLISAGEQSFRVFTHGAPMLDELVSGQEVASAHEIYERYDIDRTRDTFLLVFHPVTEELDSVAGYTKNVFDAVNRFGEQTVVIMPNSDAGSKDVKRVIERSLSSDMKVFHNLPRRDYAGLLNISRVMIGNSSSGIIEAPVFKLPVVNIGRRQIGRECADNVIHCSYEVGDIVQAIERARGDAFRSSIAHVQSPYGDGLSAQRIVDTLKTIEVNSDLLIKRLTF